MLGWWIRKRSRGETWEGQKAGRLELGQDMRPGEVPGKGLGGMLLRVHLCHQSGIPQKPLCGPACPRRILDLWQICWYSTVSVKVNANTYVIPYACRMECDPSVVPQA